METRLARSRVYDSRNVLNLKEGTPTTAKNDEWLMTYSNPAFGIFPLKFITTNGKVSMDVKVNDFLEYDPYTFVKE